MNYLINAIGLTFDITGVLGLFFYGVPPTLSKNGEKYFVANDTDKSEAIKWTKYNFISKVSLVLIILGFAFQMASTYLSFVVSGNNNATNHTNCESKKTK